MTRWAIHHERHGAMSYLNAQLMISDPIKVRCVEGVALMDTRTTARTIIRKLEEKGVPMNGYKPVRATVRVEVVR